MKCHRYGKESKQERKEETKPEIIAAVAQKGPKRKTIVQVKTNCPVVMVVKEINGIL